MNKFELPVFISGVTQENYNTWLHNRAKAHAVRDRKRFPNKTIRVADYKTQIHLAVVESEGRDQYTNKPLLWKKILKFHNGMTWEERRELLDAPSVDHNFKQNDKFNFDFKICSRRTNSCKNDLSVDELISFCKTFLKNQII